MNEIKISVIVPVYKVEAYLHRCVDSILAQTYKNLEIILVDDGSPDNCPAVCDEYAMKDPRIQVIHKKNGGLSDARNAGLEIATGDWLSFIDSDDHIEPDMYETLLQNAKKYDAQISVGGVNDELVDDDQTTVFKTTFDGQVNEECLSPIDAMKRHLAGSWAAWDKIYEKQIFDGIRYPVGEINEDEPIMLLLLDRCQRIVYTNRVFYHYIHRPESITSTSFHVKKLAWVKHCDQNLAWIQANHPELEPLAAARYRGSILWALREIALSSDEFPAEIKALRRALKENARAFSAAPFSSRGEQMRYWMSKNCPFSIYRAILRLRHK